MNSYWNPVVDMTDYINRDLATDVRVAYCLGLRVRSEQRTEDGPIEYYTQKDSSSEFQPLANYSGKLEETKKLIDLLEQEIKDEDIEFFIIDPNPHYVMIISLKNKQSTFRGFGRTMQIAFCNAWCDYQESKRNK